MWVFCHCGGAPLISPRVETEGENCMLLGGHQNTVPVCHLPGRDVKVQAGATSPVKANTGFHVPGCYNQGFAPWGGS